MRQDAQMRGGQTKTTYPAAAAQTERARNGRFRSNARIVEWGGEGAWENKQTDRAARALEEGLCIKMDEDCNRKYMNDQAGWTYPAIHS